MNDEFFKVAMKRVDSLTLDELRMIAKTHGIDLVRKPTESRNKREGYYAGHYRPSSDFAHKTKPRAHRWPWWDMLEFYPPVWGSVWNLV